MFVQKAAQSEMAARPFQIGTRHTIPDKDDGDHEKVEFQVEGLFRDDSEEETSQLLSNRTQTKKPKPSARKKKQQEYEEEYKKKALE